MVQPRETWVKADFNGLFGDLLCLSHGDTVQSLSGTEVRLVQGMVLTAAEPYDEDGWTPAWLVATGVVEVSPDWLTCKGSRWVLRLDEDGAHHVRDA